MNRSRIITDNWTHLRPTFAEIDLGALSANICALRVRSKSPLMAVVKADAYGHGVFAVVERARALGVNWFGVATADEALAIRELAPNILVLSPVTEQAMHILTEQHISFCVSTPEQIVAAASAAKKVGIAAKLHLKLDTGMGRVGIATQSELTRAIELLGAPLELEGVYTHFATADDADPEFSKLQAERFLRAVSKIKKSGFSPIIHAANSAAIAAYSEFHFDLTRAGISLYGVTANEFSEPLPLRQVMSLKSQITQVKEIEVGQSVSYGRTFFAENPTKIATVCIGYADGYMRANSNKSCALVHGARVPVVGRVCMDQIMLDVTEIEDVRAGDEVVLLGYQGGEFIGAEEIAKNCGTISYEVFTSVSARVPRGYT